MTTQPPRISVGLPVYNGERYLEEALVSLREQTEPDLEIIISDNASTDGTADICRRFAAADPRIRYHRQERNIGAGPNYNWVFHQARGRYFKWAAHDDTMDAGLLAACADVLDARPEAVLCFGQLVDVDDEGREIRVHERDVPGDAPTPERFAAMITVMHNCAEIFGLIRRDVLARSLLIRDYTDSDRTLLAQLTLAGTTPQLTSVRFYRRMHANKSDRAYGHYFDRAVWFNPANKRKLVLSATLQARDLVRVVLTSTAPARDKRACLWRLAKQIKWNAPIYRAEAEWAFKRLLRRA